MLRVMSGPQHRKLECFECVLYDSGSDLRGVSAAPFRFDQSESHLVSFRRRVRPGSQTAGAYELLSCGLEYRPVLNAMFFSAGDFGMHFLQDLFVAEWTAEKSHHVRIAPETLC